MHLKISSAQFRYFRAGAPFFWHGLALITAWVSNHMYSKVWDEITYLFPKFNGFANEVWESISNSTPHFILYVVTYLC